MAKTQSPIKAQTILRDKMFTFGNSLYYLDEKKTVEENYKRGYDIHGQTVVLIGNTADESSEIIELSTYCEVAPPGTPSKSIVEAVAPIAEKTIKTFRDQQAAAEKKPAEKKKKKVVVKAVEAKKPTPKKAPVATKKPAKKKK